MNPLGAIIFLVFFIGIIIGVGIGMVLEDAEDILKLRDRRREDDK